MGDVIFADPMTLDFSGDAKYYYKNEYIHYNQVSGKLYTISDSESNVIYQITAVTKSSETTIWHNFSYDSIAYKLSLITLTETELETNQSDKGLYQGIDDYGTTYYYRGNVKNNIAFFAGFYWQIIRVNGDGSIRLIYNGTEKNAIGAQQLIDNKTYQFNGKYNNPTYVGYMYGNPNGTTFDKVHTNINDSTIKSITDNWYKINIIDKGYGDYISSTVGFCGDRTLHSGDGISTSSYTYFRAYERAEQNTAQFTCPNVERDLYTSTDSSVGNKSLTYPVGLITYDELVFAGMDNRHINKLSWAYSTKNYWTMSPSYFDATSGGALEWLQHSTGSLYLWTWIADSYGVRPVINLKSDVKITGGTGTANDPFVVDTNS